MPARVACVVTTVSLSAPGPPDKIGRSVVASRRTPFDSDSDHWLRRTPGTLPLARYTVCVGLEMSKRWIVVLTVLGASVGVFGLGRLAHASVVTKRLDCDA